MTDLKTINLFSDDCTRCVRISDTRGRRQVTRFSTFAPLNVILHLLQILVSYCGRVSRSDAIRCEEFILIDGILETFRNSISKKLSAIVGYNLKIFLIVFLSFYSYIIIILFSSISFKKKSKVSNFEMFRRLHGFYLWMKLQIITPCCIMRIRNKCRRTIIYEE